MKPQGRKDLLGEAKKTRDAQNFALQNCNICKQGAEKIVQSIFQIEAFIT